MNCTFSSAKCDLSSLQGSAQFSVLVTVKTREKNLHFSS